MNIEIAREYCLNRKGAMESFPFGEDILVMKVMGKMFAAIPLNLADRISLKCDPDYAIELREKYNAIDGAYHFNKKYWIQVIFNYDTDDKLIKRLIDHSFEQVIKKFSVKLKKEYEELP